MSSYKQQEYDFVIRTTEIIKQYNTSPISPKYEVTLLLNCFVGLLILPQQLWHTDLHPSIISEKEWGISASHIGYIKYGEIKSVQNIVRHLRNSISHYSFIAFDNNRSEISRIQFKDYDRNKNKVFEATIPIGNLRCFLKIFSNLMLKKMQEAKV